MTTFFLALFVFFATHMIPAMPRIRGRLVAIAGERTYLVAYSLLSLAVLVWLIAAAIEAPHVQLWEQAPWMRWLPVVVMPFACILIVAGLSTPNAGSISFAGKRNPELPEGIVTITRHPVLWGFGLWALAHILPNGHLVALILFGLFAVLAFGGMAITDMKARRRMGEAAWQHHVGRTSILPFVAYVQGRARPAFSGKDFVRLAGGLLLFALLIPFHIYALGRWPLPL